MLQTVKVGLLNNASFMAIFMDIIAHSKIDATKQNESSDRNTTLFDAKFYYKNGTFTYLFSPCVPPNCKVN